MKNKDNNDCCVSVVVIGRAKSKSWTVVWSWSVPDGERSQELFLPELCSVKINVVTSFKIRLMSLIFLINAQNFTSVRI